MILASLPPWLIEALNKPVVRPRLTLKTTNINQGARNDVLSRIAYGLRKKGLSVEVIEAALLKENERECKPPLEADEVHKIAIGKASIEPDESPDHDELFDTDIANARRFVREHFENVRYTSEHGWFAWDGRRWVPNSLPVTEMAKKTALGIYDEIRKASDSERSRLFSHARRSQTASGIQSMLQLARSDPGIVTPLSNFDAKEFLLNVENGTLDLQVGKLMLRHNEPKLSPHRREDHCSRIVNIPYDSSADCPLWEKFLREVMNDDNGIVDYLQRAVGYTLTGSTKEQVLFFLYGRGSNGKSVFLEILKEVLGEYGIAASIETFLSRNRAGIPNDVARLAGARLVSVGETPENTRWNESLIKDVTGGDTITARFLHREFFDFRTRCKVWNRGNHKPEVRGTDEGIWRRMHLIPFNVQIPEDKRDRHLFEKLRKELPGILAWAVRGCVRWQREGLRPPSAVVGATRAYRHEQDTLGGFIKDHCVAKPGSEITVQALYSAYKTWCDDNGEPALNQKTFGTAITERGFERARTNRARIYRGLDLRLLR